ncbi:GPW/gp25 family protein [Bacteroides heparinolyticus]|uniref:GPW/gp25 family protein n=1 Tax=Prevotella heparinolytica TaxID=28113 RepID=UPI00359F2FC6
MRETYYKIPFDFGTLLDEERGMQERCSEKESIYRHIELLITTCPGEHIYDRDFGSEIWDMDFERIVSLETWKTKFKKFLYKAISAYERRISGCDLKLEVSDVLHENVSDTNVSVRKRVDIYIETTVVSSGERLNLHHRLYLGPLSKQ